MRITSVRFGNNLELPSHTIPEDLRKRLDIDWAGLMEVNGQRGFRQFKKRLPDLVALARKHPGLHMTMRELDKGNGRKTEQVILTMNGQNPIKLEARFDTWKGLETIRHFAKRVYEAAKTLCEIEEIYS
jgi:hypothetical protein